MRLFRYLRTLFTVLVLSAAGFAHAAWPDKPIRLIVPSAVGGSPDVAMRILADQLSKALGQQIIVDNRPGASGNIGMETAAKAPADGYTLVYVNVGTLAINRALFNRLPYDPDKDFSLVAQVLTTCNLLAVNPALPVQSVRELIDYAKRHPGKLTMASAGNGTTGHLGGELFKAMTGTFIVHIPYRGSGPAITDVIGGQVDLIFDNLVSITPQAKNGKVRPLGVSSLARSPVFPQVPAIAEAGVPGYETAAWGGVAVPAGTPREVVARLNAEINKALLTSALKEKFAAIGADPVGGTPEQFAALVKSETPKWAAVIKQSGAKLD